MNVIRAFLSKIKETRIKNLRETCVCLCQRRSVSEHIWRVSDKEDDPFIPKYYFRCPHCGSFSAPKIVFPKEKYSTLPIEFYAKGPLTGQLAETRVSAIRTRLEGGAPLLLDLGAGGGWVAKAFVSSLPGASAIACEADARLEAVYYADAAGVRFEGRWIDDFLDDFVARGRAADAVAMTDVLEHMIFPEATVRRIHKAMRPGGIGYFVVPNAQTFMPPHPFPVAARDVDWPHALRTCQHIWMMSPEAFEGLFTAAGFEVLAHDLALETDIRRDSVYSTVIVRR